MDNTTKQWMLLYSFGNNIQTIMDSIYDNKKGDITESELLEIYEYVTSVLNDIKECNKTLKFRNNVVPQLEKTERPTMWHTQKLILDTHYVRENDDTDYMDVYDATNFSYIGKAISSKRLENSIVKTYKEEFENGRLVVYQHFYPIENSNLYLENLKYLFYAPEEFELREEKTKIMQVSQLLDRRCFFRITDNNKKTITQNKPSWCTYNTYFEWKYNSWEVDKIIKRLNEIEKH